MFPFIKFWLVFCLGLIMTAPHVYGLDTDMSAAKDMYLTVRLMKQQGHLAFEVSLENKTSVELRLGFGDCPLTYVVVAGKKNYTYPEKQPFVPARVCTQSFRELKISPKGSVVVFTAQVRDDLSNALVKAKGNYSGEFRFILSSATSKKMLQLIYKRQLRKN